MSHRHFWDARVDGRWECADCAEVCEACIECGRWTGTSLLICEACVGRVRGLLDDIETAMALRSPSPRSLIPAIRYDRDRISGSWGDDDGPGRWSFEDLQEILAGWADAWAEAVGIERSIEPVDFLRGRILWAAHNRDDSDWGQWLDEMAHALMVAKREAGLLPRRMSAPCVHCGGVAVRDWADKDLTPNPDGLSDEVRCLRCRRTWPTQARFEQLSKQHLHGLPEARPDALVTVKQAELVWPDIPAVTWRVWATRGEIPDALSWDERGVPLFRVGDLAVLVERRVDETRRGRRAG